MTIKIFGLFVLFAVKAYLILLLAIKAVNFIIARLALRKKHLITLELNSVSKNDFLNHIKEKTLEVGDLNNYTYNIDYFLEIFKLSFSPKDDLRLHQLQKDFFHENTDSEKIFMGDVQEDSVKIGFIETIGNDTHDLNSMRKEAEKILARLSKDFDFSNLKGYEKFVFYRYITTYDYEIKFDTNSNSQKVTINMVPARRGLLFTTLGSKNSLYSNLISYDDMLTGKQIDSEIIDFMKKLNLFPFVIKGSPIQEFCQIRLACINIIVGIALFFIFIMTLNLSKINLSLFLDIGFLIYFGAILSYILLHKKCIKELDVHIHRYNEILKDLMQNLLTK